MKALIMGGGMSGLAAAVNLLDQGIDVEIIEADEIFGGRASSWLDEDTCPAADSRLFDELNRSPVILLTGLVIEADSIMPRTIAIINAITVTVRIIIVI